MSIWMLVLEIREWVRRGTGDFPAEWKGSGSHEWSGPNQEVTHHPTIHLEGAATEREGVKAEKVLERVYERGRLRLAWKQVERNAGQPA
jgi:hypothetical protein